MRTKYESKDKQLPAHIQLANLLQEIKAFFDEYPFPAPGTDIYADYTSRTDYLTAVNELSVCLPHWLRTINTLSDAMHVGHATIDVGQVNEQPYIEEQLTSFFRALKSLAPEVEAIIAFINERSGRRVRRDRLILERVAQINQFWQTTPSSMDLESADSQPTSSVLDTIPEEVLFAILRFLPSVTLHDVKQVSRRFYQIIKDPIFIKSIMKQYFSHHQGTDFKKTLETQWPTSGKQLPEKLCLLLMGNNALLKEKIKPADLYLHDKDELSLYDWAYKADNQNILNYIYEHLIVPFYQNEDGKINITQIDGATGYTLLHWAIICRQSLDLILGLTDLGFQLDAIPPHQLTSLHVAARAGHLELVNYVLSQGEAKMNAARANDGATALFIAAKNGHANVIRLLLAHDKHIETFKHWLDYDQEQINVNAVCTTDGATALFIAAEKGHTKVVRFLLAHDKIDVNAASTVDGATALFIAAQNGHTEVVRHLLAQPQTNVNAARTDGATALYMAAQNGHADVVKLLAAHSKTNINASFPDDGATALHIAVQENHIDIVNCLLANKASAASGMQEDIQILLALAEKNHCKSALEAWFKAKYQDPLPDHIPGITPLDIAIIAGHNHIAQSLLEAADDFSEEKIIQAWQIAKVMANQVIVAQLQTILQHHQSKSSRIKPQVSIGTSGFFTPSTSSEISPSSTSCLYSC